MSSSTRRVLGRGLADLIPVGGDAPGNGINAPDASQETPISTLHANPKQPRTYFDPDALAELAESVRINGILQPILVRPRAAGGYEIVAGERRYRAALRAGLRTVPVVVRDLTDAESLALALIENLIREDIGPLESARAFQRLMREFGWTQEEMAERVGRSRTAIANSLRLLTLPAAIQDGLEHGQLTEGHARCLIGDERVRSHPDFSARQLALFQEIIARGLTVRETEKRMRDVSTDSPTGASASPARRSGSRSSAAAEDIELRSLEDRLRQALGARTRLVGTLTRGRLEIDYFTPGDLESLLERIEQLRP